MMMSELTNIKGTATCQHRTLFFVKECRTSHNGSYACDQVDDFGLHARIGPRAKSRVVRGGRKVNCYIRQSFVESIKAFRGFVLRARKRSSERMATALMSSTATASC